MTYSWVCVGLQVISLLHKGLVLLSLPFLHQDTFNMYHQTLPPSLHRSICDSITNTILTALTGMLCEEGNWTQVASSSVKPIQRHISGLHGSTMWSHSALRKRPQKSHFGIFRDQVEQCSDCPGSSLLEGSLVVCLSLAASCLLQGSHAMHTAGAGASFQEEI